VPDTKGRYYLMPILDAWSNVIGSPGARTTGTSAGHFAVTGPGWNGTLPPGIKQQIKSPTSFCWIIGRTQTDGPKDYAVVNAIQQQYKLTPLSAFGKDYTPPSNVAVDQGADTKTPPLEQVEKMDAGQFFNRLALLLKDNPPTPEDAPMMARLAKLGIYPGKPFDISKVDPEIAAGLQGASKNAIKLLDEAIQLTSKKVNGWTLFPSNIGVFGTDYKTRAAVAQMGLGANTMEDAVYPTAYTDEDGNILEGSNRYTLRFEKGATPPANAFWSLTLYDARSFFVPNAINRQNLAAWMPLKYNSDGSLDLYFQASSPGRDKEANWLPAPPSGAFSVTMRVYWPKPEVTGGAWKPPAIRKIK
jgi:hypothetical protein